MHPSYISLDTDWGRMLSWHGLQIIASCQSDLEKSAALTAVDVNDKNIIMNAIVHFIETPFQIDNYI